ncbi:MAG: beta-ketoacyl synthase [Candidatus Marinimicrobia bacterium]|nr:beta-ketoacyl synthase [Candidatus Neomarinimicrobiota bacterium]
MANNSQIIITGMGCISPLGADPNRIWRNYLRAKSKIQVHSIGNKDVLCAPLGEPEIEYLQDIRGENKQYGHIDDTVVMAISASRHAVKMARWGGSEKVGVSIGSSRGATATWEAHHETLLEKGRLSPLASPTSTLGNISSWVAQDLSLNGPAISHSMTCTTGIHSIANGMAWLKSNMCDRFLCGGSEAPLTPFTVKQFQALGLYSQDVDALFPCMPLVAENNPKNRLVLGEGAAVFAIELFDNHHEKHIIATINGLGFGFEALTSSTSISDSGEGLEKSMLNAMDDAEINNVDAIIMHAPGTIQGDSAELNAIYKVFGDVHPVLLSNKWMIGHTFGASAALSVELAIHILHNQEYADFPYPARVPSTKKEIKNIMINSAGFGGNCASLIISR